MTINNAVHCLHVYTGNGKGKTSTAVGAAVRMRGHGGTVLFAQFLKDGNSGELASLRKLGIEIEAMPAVKGFFSRMSDSEKAACRSCQQKAADSLVSHIRQVQPSMVILDELCVALSLGILTEEEGSALIEAGLQHGETLVTGRGAPEWLMRRADYLTVLKAEKHPYSVGLAAREGIEW